MLYYRRLAGISNNTKLSELIFEKTDEEIPKDVLYRLQEGRQEPTARQFFAINYTLFGHNYVTVHDVDVGVD